MNNVKKITLLILLTIAVLSTTANAMYSTQTGRFLQKDPLGTDPTDDPAKNAFQVKRQYKDGANLYQYVKSNPLAELDPYGLMGFGCSLPPGKLPDASDPDMRIAIGSATELICQGIVAADEINPASDFMDCWADCIEEHDKGGVLGMIIKKGGLLGVRFPKKFPRVGKPCTKSIFETRCVRNALRLKIKPGMIIGRIFIPLTLVDGAYYVCLNSYCIGKCSGVGKGTPDEKGWNPPYDGGSFR